MASLQEQLLKAGVVEKGKAKDIAREKRKQAKQQPKGQAPVNEAREQARKSQAEKVERDREINLQRQQEAELKAVAAQIRQLIDMNKIDRGQGSVAYQFVDAGKIKKIHLTPQLQDQLIKGRAAVVRSSPGYELVPAVVADKISQRDDGMVLVLNQQQQHDGEPDEDDPYADYKIPDDLMW